MKTTLFLALLFLSLNSEGASAARSAEDIAAKKAAKKAYQAAARAAKNARLKEWRKANRERRNAQQKGYRDTAKLESASSWLVGGKPLFDVEPLGPDEDAHFDLACFAFGAGKGAHLDLFKKKTADKKRARSDGAKGGPATKK